MPLREAACGFYGVGSRWRDYGAYAGAGFRLVCPAMKAGILSGAGGQPASLVTNAAGRSSVGVQNMSTTGSDGFGAVQYDG